MIMIKLKINNVRNNKSLIRKGSTTSVATPCMIDIYETYVIDKDFNLKKVTFYFNGYFSRGKAVVRLPDGFEIKPHSRLRGIFEFRH